MKKIFTIMFLVFCAAVANAQFQLGDTLVLGERWPTYYYWGDNWIDRFPLNGWSVGNRTVLDSRCKPEMARYCYTDSSLRVVGIAVTMDFLLHHESDTYNLEDAYKDLQTEYFRLYEVDSATDEMVLLAEKPLIDTSIVCYLPAGDDGILFGRRPRGLPTREVYFDSAITVHDSFYVSVTGYNNYRRELSPYKAYFTTRVYGNVCSNPEVSPNPRHYRKKLHLVNGYDVDHAYNITDTNWHAYRFYYSDTNVFDWNVFMMMFPIIDTTLSQAWVPECPTPRDLSVVHAGKEVVVLAWDDYGASEWELALVSDGENFDAATPMACNSAVTPIYGLDTARWFSARVRSVCGDDRRSEWSDTIRFFVPGDTTSTDPTEGISNVVERYTYLMPNPASGQVSVMSSFRIDRVEIYTLAGQRILQENAAGLSAQIDISALAQGTYIVRTYTNRGVSNKRLVVR